MFACRKVAGTPILEASTTSQAKKEPNLQPPDAEVEKDVTSTQDMGDLEPLDALSHMRESLRQQLKMRKKRAAEEPFEIVTSSIDPIRTTSQRFAAKDALIVGSSGADAGNWASLVHTDVDVIAATSHKAPASGQTKDQKDRKDQKLVCLEFCQCVCLMEEPVAAGPQAHVGMCCVWPRGLSACTTFPFPLQLCLV
jgi:hypothetical protein